MGAASGVNITGGSTVYEYIGENVLKGNLLAKYSFGDTITIGAKVSHVHYYNSPLNSFFCLRIA
jgi:hypothetical protein